jgi:hypothetical protein
LLHPEALTVETAQVAAPLCQVLAGSLFVLAGGTALALQLGHRLSVDLDWFCPPSAWPPDLMKRLSALDLPLVPIAETEGTVHVLVQGVRCSFLAVPVEFGAPLARLHGMPLATPSDIGAMKLVAVSQRGARKDFVDLHALLEREDFPALATRLYTLYTSPPPNPVHVAKSLVWFEDAERDPMPRLLGERPWPVIKAWFEKRAKLHTAWLQQAASQAES